MLEFTVQVKGLHDVEGGQATWVLAVDPTAGVLIAHEDKTLHWHLLADCTFAGMVKPDKPRPVYAVQLTRKEPNIVKPDGILTFPNGAIERNGA